MTTEAQLKTQMDKLNMFESAMFEGDKVSTF